MKISAKLFHTSAPLAFSLLMTGSLLAGISPAFAQVDPLDANNERTSDPFSEQGGNSNDAFFDMMHRIQLGNIRSVSEFGRDQQNSIDTTAEDFRTRQRAVLQQQSQPALSDNVTPSTVDLTPDQIPTNQ